MLHGISEQQCCMRCVVQLALATRCRTFRAGSGQSDCNQESALPYQQESKPETLDYQKIERCDLSCSPSLYFQIHIQSIEVSDKLRFCGSPNTSRILHSVRICCRASELHTWCHVRFLLVNFFEQHNSEDVSLSMPIVHIRVSVLFLVTERVSLEAQGQYSAGPQS